MGTTAGRMVFCYATHVVLFGAFVQSWALTGAALMMTSVVLMVATRVPSSAPAQALPEGAGSDAEKSKDMPQDIPDNVSACSKESFASFVSTEFAVVSGASTSLPRRRPQMKE